MKGQAAYLVSSFIKKNDFKKCLNFFYLMSGRDVGSLQLRIVYESGRHMMLWERTTDMGEDWKQGAATLPITDERYKACPFLIAIYIGSILTNYIKVRSMYRNDARKSYRTVLDCKFAY